MVKLPQLLEDNLTDLTPPSGGSTATSDFIPNFTIQQQEASQWCWASCSCSTSQFFNPTSTWTQCAIVNQRRGRSDCCTNKRSRNCDKADGLELGLAVTNNYNGNNSGLLDLTVLKVEIQNRQPMFICLSGGNNHFVAITGYSVDSNGKKSYKVQDPDGATTSDVSVDILEKGGYNGRGGMFWYYFTKP